MTGARVVAGRYAIVGELGRGGMGVVWRAQDGVIGRQVAVKEVRFPGGLSDDERAVVTERVLREARTAGRLNDPGIVTVHDVLPHPDAIFIVMELVEAPTLAGLVARDGPLPAARVADIGRQALSALGKAHAAGIVHRDVKPSNIMVLPGDRVKLADFGIAHATDDPRLTQSGTMGTPGYMAPELFLGGRPSPASDLWSLGATLYFAIEGQAPFERPSSGQTLHAVLYENPQFRLCTGALAATISGLLTREGGVAGRLTASDAFRQLDAQVELARQNVPGPTTPVTRVSRPPAPRGRAVVWTAVVFVVVAALGVGGYLLLRPREGTGASLPCPTTPPANVALVDRALTTEVTGLTTKAVERLFTYDAKNLAATDAAAQELLTGQARTQYESLMKAVKEQAPQRQGGVTSRVTAMAPAEVSATEAKVLAAVSQTAVRANNDAPSGTLGEVLITVGRADGTWKITDISLTPSLRSAAAPQDTPPEACPKASEYQLASLRDGVREAGSHAAEVLTTIAARGRRGAPPPRRSPRSGRSWSPTSCLRPAPPGR
ncbi:serine/threonine-protein kinase [Actinocrispum wychmicini]|uniref:serine/threonine-protein kinase n=1 Tax=Actinocrispum wychmicini TaxID=1213861 RepID=UPI0024417971|nr:serine/threonine-protein kinase [Actinocrispum wychmicini]